MAEKEMYLYQVALLDGNKIILPPTSIMASTPEKAKAKALIAAEVNSAAIENVRAVYLPFVM